MTEDLLKKRFKDWAIKGVILQENSQKNLTLKQLEIKWYVVFLRVQQTIEQRVGQNQMLILSIN
jgi:hypothetical protein